MNARVISKITIAANTEDVFKYLVELKYHFFWNPHLQKLEPQTRLNKGMCYKSSSVLLGVKVTGENKVVKIIDNEELEIENHSGPLTYNVNYRLRSAGENTLLFCTTEVFSKSKAFAFSAPLLKQLAQRELQSDLKALKIAVEQKIT